MGILKSLLARVKATETFNRVWKHERPDIEGSIGRRTERGDGVARHEMEPLTQQSFGDARTQSSPRLVPDRKLIRRSRATRPGSGRFQIPLPEAYR